MLRPNATAQMLLVFTLHRVVRSRRVLMTATYNSKTLN